MNQKVLIVFSLFLLITILLLLLMSDARAKSSRIRVLVNIPGNPADSGIMKILKSFFDKIASENNFIFFIADETNQQDLHPSEYYSVVLLLQPSALSYEWNEDQRSPTQPLVPTNEPDSLHQNFGSNPPLIWRNPTDPHVIHIAIGHDARLCSDPVFSIRVRDAILQVTASVQSQRQGNG